MSKFTPGKWEEDVLYGGHFVVFAGGHVAADCFKNEGNARLIAAAPEMYRLLHILTSLDSEMNDERFDALILAVNEARELLARIDSEEAQA